MNTQFNWYFEYNQYDFGTERHLTVKNRETGAVIGPVDPFPNGIPMNQERHKKIIRATAMQMIEDYQERAQ